MVDVDVRISSHLKEEMTMAIDKQLRVINNLKNSKSAKELKGTNCMHCYVALSYVF